MPLSQRDLQRDLHRFAAFLLLAVAGCSDLGLPVRPRAPGTGTLQPPTTTVSFAGDVRPIFAFHCDACHSFSDPATGYAQMTVQPIPYPPGVRIKPFDLVNSVLYGKITNSGQYGQLMPQGGPLIPLEDRNTIRDWILEGARDN